MSRRLVVSCALVLLVAWGAPAEVVYTLESPNPEHSGHFGHSVSVAGDVNDDGFNDFVVGAFEELGGGMAHVFSGGTGDALCAMTTWPGVGGHFGCSVSGTGDVNGDGYPDVLVGAECGGPNFDGAAYIFNGQTGGCLDTLVPPEVQAPQCFGWSVSGAGDANNDGYADVIVGAPDGPFSPTSPGKAYIFSGHTGDCLDTLVSPNQSCDNYFGRSVSGIGDVDGDGHGDVVVGAPGEYYDAGRAYVFAGQTGDTLYSLTSPNPQHGGFGYAVSEAADVDGNGVPDLVIGAGGEAYVFSGDDGALLHILQAPPNQIAFGWCVSAAGDVNDDGYDDVVVGDPFAEGAGRAYVFGGQTGTLLWTLDSPNPKEFGYFACSVSGSGNVDSTGLQRVVVGAACEDAGAAEAGRAYVFTFNMSLSSTLSGGELVLSWTPWPGAYSYWVYGALNQAYFEPEFVTPYQYRLQVLPSGTTTWSTPSGVGDPAGNWTYLVLAVDQTEQVLGCSNRAGEHDFDTGN